MKVRRGVGPLLVVAAAAGLAVVAGAGAERRHVAADELTKWRFAFNGVNKLGSRISGSGTATARVSPSGTRTTPVKAAGAASHFDKYFTDEQNERLSLTVIGVSGESKLEADAVDGDDQLLDLNVRVKSSSHPKSCPVGARGTVALDDLGFQAPDVIRLKICGREHDHRYIHSKKYPVQVTVKEVIDPADVQAILTVNGNTVQHDAIGYESPIRFKHGTLLRMEASAAKRLPRGWRLLLHSEHDPLNGTPPMVYNQYRILCDLKGGDRECPTLSRPSTFPLTQGGCHRVAAEIHAPNPPRRVSTAAVCMTPVP